MKTSAFGVACLGIFVTTIMTLLQLVNIDTRAVNLQDNLQQALESSIDTAFDDRAYTIQDEQALVADVVEGIVTQLSDDNIELHVKVNEVDLALGIVSVEVTGKYRSVESGDLSAAGTGSTVKAERTVILEKFETESLGKFEVQLLNSSGGVFKSYSLTAGEKFPTYPVGQVAPGCTFTGWKDISSNRSYRASVPNEVQAFNNLVLDKNYQFTLLSTCG